MALGCKNENNDNSHKKQQERRPYVCGACGRSSVVAIATGVVKRSCSAVAAGDRACRCIRRERFATTSASTRGSHVAVVAASRIAFGRVKMAILHCDDIEPRQYVLQSALTRYAASECGIGASICTGVGTDKLPSQGTFQWMLLKTRCKRGK